MEGLEPRTLLSAFVVTNTNDAGDGSLRAEIVAADATTGPSVIQFDIPGAGVQTIRPQSPLPVLAAPVTIDGTTQPGYSGTPLIELDGEDAGPDTDGLQTNGGVVGGLAINRFGGVGVQILARSNVSTSALTGCFIGTDPTGAVALPNGNGVVISGSGVLVGGATPTARNLISGNRGAGILVNADSVSIEGNYIGTTAAGSLPLGNGGPGVQTPAGNAGIRSLTIGAFGPTTQGAGNLISGNGGSGILCVGGGTNVQIFGNMIGLDQAGARAIPNGADPGAEFRDGVSLVNVNASVGLPGTNRRNVISGNMGSGIRASGASVSVQNDYVGTNAAGTAAVGNAVDGVLLDQRTAAVFGDTVPGAGDVISANAQDGVFALNAFDVQMTACLIGTDAGGGFAIGNGGDGFHSLNTSSLSLGAFNARNVIAGNGGDGIRLQQLNGGNIQDDFIGTDATGMQPLGNAKNGIEITAATVSIGAGGPAGNIVVSANSGAGIVVTGDGKTGTTGSIAHSFIGVNAAGQGGQAFGNKGDGITLVDSRQFLVGSTDPPSTVESAPPKGNVIAFNGGSGISVVKTVDAQGLVGSIDSIEDNLIYSNGKLGIDLGGDGITPNDPGDADQGPNDLLNFPVINSAYVNTAMLVIDLTFNGRAGNYRVQLYASPSPDSSGYGQGQRILGDLPVHVDASGSASMTVPFSLSVPTGWFITATATDASGNTSEFSKAVEAVPPTPPTVRSASFEVRLGHPVLTFRFDQDVTGKAAAEALMLENADTGKQVFRPGSGYDPATHTLSYVYSAPLTDGNYLATLDGSTVSNAFGQHLSGNGGGTSYSFSFFYLLGDTNGDRVVDFADVLALSRNYGRTGTLSDGDVNSDGVIDFRDLLAVAQNFGHNVSPIAATTTQFHRVRRR